MERNGCGLTGALPQYFLAEAWQNHRNLREDSWHPSGDLNQPHPKPRSRALILIQHVQ